MTEATAPVGPVLKSSILTDDDLVQMQLIPFIALSEALADAGHVSLNAVADHIALRLTADDRTPWGTMAVALIDLLRRSEKTSQAKGATHRPKPIFTVVPG